MRFRPCIDLRNGKVVQIVGSTLSDAGRDTVTNYESAHGADFYARMYREDGLEGGHVIMLGPGNAEAAAAALAAYPGGLQLGGGISPDNAHFLLDKGAQKLIVTSWVFEFGELSLGRLAQLNAVVNPEHLVLDLSCVRRGDDYVVAINRWQTLTSMTVSAETLESLSSHCSEFLIHAVDVEGKQQGIDGELVSRLARWSPIPVTYAGGVGSMDDIKLIRKLGANRIDATVGSALDIFGGRGVRYRELVEFDRLSRLL